MTGIIFNLLEEAVTRRFGAGAWAEMLVKVDVGGYLPFDKYPDDELFRLLGALPVATEMGAEERLRWFGRAAVPLLAARYPLIFAPHQSAESFLLTLNAILHPGGQAPADVEAGPLDLEVLEVEPPGGLVLGYRSARRLCSSVSTLPATAPASRARSIPHSPPSRVSASWSARSTSNRLIG